MSRLDSLAELALLEEIESRKCIRSNYYWLTRGTHTEDEQALPGQAIKPFPQRDYFPPILKMMRDEPITYIEKSRTMMMTWLASGFAAHYGFETPYTGVIFQSKDEDRAVHCVQCVKVLWRESLPKLKARWPLKKDYDKQAYNKFELANGSWFIGLPGDPDKIRFKHPTLVVLDEAAFLPDFSASFDTAAATRCLKIIALSSANPGGFRDATRDAAPAAWPNPEAGSKVSAPAGDGSDQVIQAWAGKYIERFRRSWSGPSPSEPTRGLRLRRTETGAPVIHLHYHADPSMNESKLKQEIKKYTSEARWRKEMEIDYEALQGALVYPEFDRSVHMVRHETIPKALTRYMSMDPHPRTPHAFLWVGIDRWGDWWIYREFWPSIVYGLARMLRDDEADNSYTIKEYAEYIAVAEGNRLEFSHVGEEDEYADYQQRNQGEDIIKRYMDQAAKGFKASADGQELESYAKRYYRYGIHCSDPKKSKGSGEDAVRELLKVRMVDGQPWPRIHISDRCPELVLEFTGHRYMLTKSPNEERDLKQQAAQYRCHMLDNLRYLATSDAGPVVNLES